MYTCKIEELNSKLKELYDSKWEIEKYATHDLLAKYSKNKKYDKIDSCKTFTKEDQNIPGWEKSFITGFVKKEQEYVVKKMLSNNNIKMTILEKKNINLRYLDILMWKWNHETVAIIPMEISAKWRTNERVGEYINYNLGTIGQHDYFEVSSQGVKDFKDKFIIYDKSRTWKYAEICDDVSKESHRLGVQVEKKDDSCKIILKTHDIIDLDPEHLKIFDLRDEKT
jgi:hypothetical protein